MLFVVVVWCAFFVFVGVLCSLWLLFFVVFVELLLLLCLLLVVCCLLFDGCWLTIVACCWLGVGRRSFFVARCRLLLFVADAR